MIHRKKLLLAGSSSTLGKALAKEYKSAGWTIVRIGRNSDSDLLLSLPNPDSVDLIKHFFKDLQPPDLVISCAGILHDEYHMPEKQLSSVEKDWLLKSMEINVMSHIHLAQGIEETLKKDRPFKWASLSAMVGSIQDNRLGGWYSYRITKAALNMFIKGLSVEWARINKENKVFAIHPGTTDSPMSKPFNVRKDKLYEPAVSARRIKAVLDKSSEYKNGSFINWDGKIIPW